MFGSTCETRVSTSRPFTVVALCLCLVLAGCGGGGSADAGGPAASPATPTTEESTPAPIGSSEQLGVENGVSASANLSVTAADGLGDGEVDAVLDRTMARVEEIRRLEFTEPVGIRFVAQSALGGGGGADLPPRKERLREQRHEATFVVGENRSVDEAYAEIFTTSVGAFYSPAAGDIVVVTDGQNRTLDTRVLAHELVHALQD